MTPEQKARAYDKLLIKAKQIYNKENDVLIIHTLEDLLPELKESEDEKTRKRVIALVNAHGQGMYKDDMLTWLENIPYTIDHEKREGFHLGYKAGLEKQGESSDKIHYWTEEEIEPIISDYLRGAEHYGGMIGRLRCLKPKSLEKQRTSYTKSDVDDAYLKGISDAKNELEKQGEQKPYGQRGECLDCQFNYAGECKGFCQMKRGEQKPADKVESKFKIGDWITNKGHSYLIADIDYEQRRYLFEVGGYTHEQLNWEYIENADNKYHLWTIEDAKDGDVLIDKSGSRECPFIFKKTKPSDIKTDMLNPLTVLGYCGIGGAGFTKGSGWGDTVNCIYYPATKEHRELLFKKMHEAGYMWDSESKQLLSLKAKPNDTQNPAWSEEDETNSYHLKTLLENLAKDNKYEFRIISDNDRDKYTAWLKSLKQRYTWKPSDEQMKALHDMNLTGNISYAGQGQVLIELYNDLKKL